jgi:adenosylcobyric acid synthase
VLNHWEKELIQGYIINKFRGDESLLRPAIEYLEQRTQIPHLGTIPYIKELKLPKEDSMFFDVIQANNNHNFDSSKINIGIIQLSCISNFTDYDPFLVEPDVKLYWLKDSIPEFIDVIIIPGSRNSFQDLLYLKEKGLDQAIVKNKNKFIIGICGGLQILGDSIIDEYGIEFKGKLNGLGLLKIETVFYQEKELRRIRAYHEHFRGEVEGYEIHHGKTMWGREKVILKKNDVVLGVSNETGNVWGTYLHGIFENDSFRRWLLNQVRIKKGLQPIENITVFNLNREIDLLAEVVRKHLNIDKIYKIIGIL